ncbi:MAG TPA: hypothetical protein VER09_12980, partial [Pseudomonas sp.]|nr:hypothetical protein [Pseudomonas sp.]
KQPGRLMVQLAAGASAKAVRHQANPGNTVLTFFQRNFDDSLITPALKCAPDTAQQQFAPENPRIEPELSPRMIGRTRHVFSTRSKQREVRPAQTFLKKTLSIIKYPAYLITRAPTIREHQYHE